MPVSTSTTEMAGRSAGSATSLTFVALDHADTSACSTAASTRFMAASCLPVLGPAQLWEPSYFITSN
jgi:hypothetical protein